MKKLLTITGAVLIVALVAVLAGATIVSAQDEPVTPDDPAQPTVPDDATPGVWGRRGFGRHGGLGLVDPDTMHEAMADALGISVEELDAARAEGKSVRELAEELGIDLADIQAAMQAVHEDALQQAVEDGLLTQEEADAISARRAEAGPGLGFGPGRGFGGGGRFGCGPGAGPGLFAADKEAMHAAIADVLDISVEELEAALDEGTTLTALAETYGVDVADLQAAMQAVREEALQQAVEDGLLTQEEADAIIERWSGAGPSFGPRGGFGGPRGHFGGGRFGGNGLNSSGWQGAQPGSQA